jgi:hypothetical protein
MISEALIILPNMRGGYANVGATVHTLFGMNRRQTLKGPNRVKNRSAAFPANVADPRLNIVEQAQ